MTDDRDRLPDGSGVSPQPKTARNERLAAQLRENLRRRKAQARALAAAGPDDLPPGT